MIVRLTKNRLNGQVVGQESSGTTFESHLTTIKLFTYKTTYTTHGSRKRNHIG